MKNEFCLRLCGIGGQGVVHLASTIAAAAEKSGVSVSVIDRPRSAMRLGPIICDLIFGQEGFAPFIVPGEADVVVGLEPLDGVLNAVYYAKRGGLVLLSEKQTPTINEIVLGERDERREALRAELAARDCRIVTADPKDLSAAGANYFLLGALVKACPSFPVQAGAVREALAGQVYNLSCFEQGLV